MAESTETFNPSDQGALRRLHGPRWQLEEDFAQPTLDMLASGRNLPKFEAEDEVDYNYRKFMSCTLDMIPDALGIRQDNIFREPPVREVDEGPYKAIIDALIADADSEGTPLDLFMRRVLWQRNATGVDVVTQMTTAPDEMEVVTLQDQRDANIRPFFLRFSPRQKFDWATTGADKYVWVRFSQGSAPAPTEMSGEPGVLRYLTLTDSTWTQWAQTQADGDEGDVEVRIVAKGEHNLGIVPAIKFYFAESMVPGEGAVPMSLITRAAVIARVAMNMKSQADIDLLAATARWLMTGFQGENAPKTVGPMYLWTTDNAEADLQVVQASIDPVTEKRTWLVMYLEEILRLLKFRGGMGDTEGHEGSGVKLALEMTDLRNELTATATAMESLELEMMRQAVVMATNDDIPAGPEAAELLGYRVKYNKQFVLDSAEELLAHMKLWFVDLVDVSESLPQIGKALLQRFRNLQIRDDDPGAEVAQDEIEAVTENPPVRTTETPPPAEDDE